MLSDDPHGDGLPPQTFQGVVDDVPPSVAGPNGPDDGEEVRVPEAEVLDRNARDQAHGQGRQAEGDAARVRLPAISE